MADEVNDVLMAAQADEDEDEQMGEPEGGQMIVDDQAGAQIHMNREIFNAENMRRLREMMLGVSTPPWNQTIEERGYLLQKLFHLKQRGEMQNGTSSLPTQVEGIVAHFLNATRKFLGGVNQFVQEGAPSELEGVTARLRHFANIPNPSIQDSSLLLQNLVTLKEQQEMLGNELSQHVLILIADYNRAGETFTQRIERFMRRHKWEHEELEATMMIVESCPSILRARGSIVRPLIIHAAAGANAAEFVVLLAKAGLKYGIGEGGGLLCQDGIGMNVFQLLVQNDFSDTLKALFDENILTRKDVREQGIPHFAAWCRSFKTLKICADLDPGCLFLEETRGRGSTLNILVCAGSNDQEKINVIKYLVKKAVQYDRMHPSIGGLLTPASHNTGGTVTTLHNMIEKFGEDTTWNLVEEILSGYTDIPFVHHVIKDAPDLVLNTIQRFPQAVFIRDNQNRLPIHVALEAGLEWSFALVSILNANISHLKDKDPVSGFYPYALAATEPSCDLKTIIHLLKLHPQHPQLSFVRS